MGLDMYLSRKSYIGNEYRRDEPLLTLSGNKTDCLSGKPLNIKDERISYIIERVGYWRKANHIHKWFVEKVQNGVDECHESPVGREALQELFDACKQALTDHNEAPTILPTQGGFFFGSTDYDEGYWQDIQDTIEILEPILGDADDQGEYFYRSSW